MPARDSAGAGAATTTVADAADAAGPAESTDPSPQDAAGSEVEEDDDEGWITPSNVAALRAKHRAGTTTEPSDGPGVVACITADFAMQVCAWRCGAAADVASTPRAAFRADRSSRLARGRGLAWPRTCSCRLACAWWASTAR